MQITLSGFQGEIPRLETRLLPNNFAENTVNASFENGVLGSIRNPALVATLGADAVSFFLFNGAWLSWGSVVDVALAPVATNRIYYTGDGAPKVRDGASVYPLALPPPAAAPTIANQSAPDPNFLQSVFFCYTYVTSLGEESAPSPLSALLDTSAGIVVRVSAFSAAPAGRAITAIRIYRSQTSAAGATGLYFVAEVATGTTFYDHNPASTPLGELLPSADFDQPPADLLGLTTMPNGMMAAFKGNEVYFCEPYQPHAWPEKYVMQVDFPIVGLAAFGSSLAVLTSGTPYIMQGTHPDSMASEKMESGMPCLSRRGIVDIGYAAIYPSVDGLVMISPNEAKLITGGLFTREQWGDFSPTTIIAERFKGQYLFMRNVEAFTVYDGNGPAGHAPGTFSTIVCSGPVLAGGPKLYASISGGTPDSSFGFQKLGSIDFEAQAPYFVETDLLIPKAMQNDPLTGHLYALGADRRSIYRWEQRDSAASTVIWRSKVFSSFVPTSLGAAFIRTIRPLATDDGFAIRIFGDGELVDTVATANEVERIIAAGMFREWQVEIETNVQVVSVQLATAVDELMVA